MRRVAVLLMLLLAVPALAGAASAPAGDTLKAVKAKGILVVGVRSDAPPFGFLDRDTGKLIGVEPDLAAAVAKRIGVALSLKPIAPGGRVQALLSGDVDLLAATMTQTEDRAKVLDFSTYYFLTTHGVLARKGTVTSLESLGGKKVAASPGSPAERALREKAPSAACYFFTSPEKAMEALKKGEVDAISASGATLYGCLNNLPKGEYEVAGSVTLAEERYRMAVRKGDAALLAEVNATLDSLEKKGEAKAILDKWFRPETPATVAAGSAPAIGAITRATGTPGRFVAIPFRGIFRVGAEVSILDTQGTQLGKGVVTSLYEDEVYVDVGELSAGVPQVGYAVAMNYRPDDASSFISDKRELFSNVKLDAMRDADQRAKEEGERFEKETKDRERYQEDMTKSKMYLDYQYSDRYYRYWPYWQ